MTSKVRIKAGTVEVDFEVSEEYMKDELPALIEMLCSLNSVDLDESEEDSQELPPSTDPNKQKLQLSTNTIASKLDVKKDGDLVLAACAHLSLVKGADTFTRSNILAEMKLATNFYKKNMTKNLSRSFKQLISHDKLLETSTGTFALPANIKAEFEAKLSGN